MRRPTVVADLVRKEKAALKALQGGARKLDAARADLTRLHQAHLDAMEARIEAELRLRLATTGGRA